MPFHIQPIREFLVRPALPASLSRMTELAYNILWSWEPLVRALFRRLDPALWRDCGDRKSTRLNSSHLVISYAVFCLKKKNNEQADAIVNASLWPFGDTCDSRDSARVPLAANTGREQHPNNADYLPSHVELSVSHVTPA